MRILALSAALLLAGCVGLSTHRAADVPAPRSIAVLPFSGSADLATRERLRSMVTGRIAQEAVLVIENEWVDRRLSEAGFLSDPATFQFFEVEAGAMCVALGVDGVLAGDLVEHESSRFLVFNSSSLGARLQLYVEDGRRAWFAKHGVSERGGLAVESGQIVNAVAKEIDYHASREVTFLGWRLVEEMFSELGELNAGLDGEHDPPEIAAASARIETKSGGVRWIVVEVEATPHSRVRFHLDARVRGVPMFETAPGRYRGIWRGTEQDALPERPRVEVEVEDRFGHEVNLEGVEWNA